MRSVNLFSININNIIKCLSPGMDGFLCVDYLLICYRSKYKHTLERKLQQYRDKINRWATENEFRFSKTKTKCVHFYHKRKLHEDLNLKLERTEIPVVDKYKFLELIFDKKKKKLLFSNWNIWRLNAVEHYNSFVRAHTVGSRSKHSAEIV